MPVVLNRFFSSFKSSYKAVVIGGGTGGLGVAVNLGNKLEHKDVAVIEPNSYHYYQPLWTFVGAGIKPFTESQRPMKDFITDEIQLFQNKVIEVDPNKNLVLLDNGRKIEYKTLIIACGIDLKWEKIKGLKQALGKNGVCSNYSVDHVVKTKEFMHGIESGTALFTQPSTPIKCAGAPQKIAYLAEEYFREKNIRQNINVMFYSGMDKIFSIDKYASSLLDICKRRNISVTLECELVEIDGKGKTATFKSLKDSKTKEQRFEFLHVTPPMGPYKFIKECSLSNKEGWVDVDEKTLQHTKYSNVYALGDCSSLPTSKTAAAAIAQSRIVTNRVLDTLFERKINTDRYDGYTSCPLIIGKDKLILAEFSGYTKERMETFPIDQSQPNQLMYWMTSKAIPELYWSFYLRGLWHGPQSFRKLFNPFAQ